MRDFQSVLTAAQELPAEDRLRLIDALWDTVSPDDEARFSDQWGCEIELRVAELKRGEAKTVPWTTVRDEALARIRHGKAS